MKKWYENCEQFAPYEIKTGIFEGHEYAIVCPKETKNGRWVLKTEYFGAFPEVECALLEKGYHVAHVCNKTRWCLETDTERQAAFAGFMHKALGLSKKCVLVGMSCGGMQGIYLGAKHPELVSCMFLDAPVVNLLSCPGGVGRLAPEENIMMQEFLRTRAIPLTELLGYRKHPLDYIPALIEHNIPLFLACGDADTSVPYEENGAILRRMYEENGCTIETVIKKGQGHHPHGLSDNTPIVDFIIKHDKN